MWFSWLRPRPRPVWRVVCTCQLRVFYDDTKRAFFVTWVLKESDDGQRQAIRSKLPMSHDKYTVDGCELQAKVAAWEQGGPLPENQKEARPVYPRFTVVDGGAA